MLAQQTRRHQANRILTMDQEPYPNEESNKMSETNINRFIEAARQYLLGLSVNDASLATPPAGANKVK